MAPNWLALKLISLSGEWMSLHKKGQISFLWQSLLEHFLMLKFSMIYVLCRFNKWDTPCFIVLFEQSNDDICVFFIGLELPFMMMPHPLIPVSLPPASVTMAMSQMNHLSTIANMAAAAQVQSPPSRVETSVIKVIVFSHDYFGFCQTDLKPPSLNWCFYSTILTSKQLGDSK